VEAAPVDRAEQSSSASETLQMPSSVLTGQGHATVSPAQAAAAMVVIKEPIEPAQQRPMMAPVAELVTATESAAAQLSSPAGVEELIDLEQQVEFFAVLGQDESAVDLLMTHLRATGGASPLPYLKLLEIYRRCDDRVAYDRTRTRFNQRFNANAPEWHSDPAQGRTLLEYGDVMSRLQAIWGTPVDAMAELETLLLRRSKGGLFDLPAYRDVLMLYGVARELHRSGDAAAQDVDVMLPLGADDQAHRAVALHLLFSHADGGEVRNEDRPTAPVDLDLSLSPLSRDSIFGVLSPVGASLRSH
jgi:hypothetical protein